MLYSFICISYYTMICADWQGGCLLQELGVQDIAYSLFLPGGTQLYSNVFIARVAQLVVVFKHK